jgi:hypothetical protein
MRDSHGKKESDALRSRNRYFQRLFEVTGREQLIDRYRENPSGEHGHHGSLCFSTARSRDPENTGIQSEK